MRRTPPPLPLYNIYSLTVNALVFLGIGARNVLIVNPRDIRALLRTLHGESFTVITTLNTLYSARLDHDAFRQRDFSKFKLAMAGSMATQRAVAERFKAVTGRGIIEGYGLTECAPLVCASPLQLNGEVLFDGSIGAGAIDARSPQAR